MDEPVKVNNVRRIKVSIAINYTRQTIIPYLAKRIPRPYIKGLDDDRRGDAITLLNVVENEDDTEILDRTSAKAFTILVQPDDFVEWKGVTTSEEEIDIEMIEFRAVGNSKNIFSKAKKKGIKENGKKKKVKQKVKGNAKGKEFSYAIQFIVDGDKYEFDPKIKVE